MPCTVPKSLNYKGLIPLPKVGQRLLERHGLQDNAIAEARVNQRLVRAAVERRPDLVVWVGARIHVLDDPRSLDDLTDETGLLQPPVTAKPARAERALALHGRGGLRLLLG